MKETSEVKKQKGTNHERKVASLKGSWFDSKKFIKLYTSMSLIADILKRMPLL